MRNIIILLALFSTSVFAWKPNFLPAITLNKMVAKEVPNLLITEKQRTVSEVTFLKSGRGLYKTNLGTSEFRWNKERNLLTLSDFSNELTTNGYYTFENRSYQVLETIQKVEYKIKREKLNFLLTRVITYSREMEWDAYDEEAGKAFNNPKFEKEFTKEVLISSANPSFLNNNTKLSANTNVVMKLDSEYVSLSTLLINGEEGEVVFASSFNSEVNQGSVFNYAKNDFGFSLEFKNGDMYEVSFITSLKPDLYKKALVKKTTANDEYVYLTEVATYNRELLLNKSDLIGSFEIAYDTSLDTPSTLVFFDNGIAQLSWPTEGSVEEGLLNFSWTLENGTIKMSRYYSPETGVINTVAELQNCMTFANCVPFQKREYRLIADRNDELLFVRHLQMNQDAFYAKNDPTINFNPNWSVDKNLSNGSLYVFKKN